MLQREIDDAILDDYLDCGDMDELTAAEAAALEMVLCPMPDSLAEGKTMSHIEKLFEIAEARGVCLQWSEGYAEPGYHCNEGIALGDWNTITRKRRVWPLGWPSFLPKPADYGRIETYVDDTAPRIGKLLAKCGVSIEWEDEWLTCSDCGRIFRCQPDCYSWTMNGAILDGECMCADCILTDPEAVLKDYAGNPDKAITFDIDMESFGYAKYNDDSYESGYHPGQNFDPHEIAKQLRKQGISDFVFAIDSCGQFDLHFSVWIKRDETTAD